MAVVAVAHTPADELLPSAKDASSAALDPAARAKQTTPSSPDPCPPASSDRPAPSPAPKPQTSVSTVSSPPPKATVICTLPASPVCEGCSEPHDGSYGSGRFCSVHCARRIAASRKWEKQRSERKRLAAAAASAASASAGSLVDQSTSSLSSASSLEGRAALKRRRVAMLPQTGLVSQPPYHPSTTPPPPPPVPHHSHQFSHYQHLVQPQPQHFSRYHSIPHHHHPLLTHLQQQQRPPFATTPPLPATSPLSATAPFVEYTQMPVRVGSPFCTPSPPAYYPYHAPVAYTPPPQYPMYASSSMPVMSHAHLPHAQIPPPPPPTPAPDLANAIAKGQVMQNPSLGVSPDLHAPQAQVSSEKECAAVANALLCLRDSKKGQ